MKNILQFKFLLFLILGVSQLSVGQNITIEIDPRYLGAVEINQTNDCLRQNSNNWYGNVCNTVDDGDDPENTDCSDCSIGGSEDMDVGALYNVGSNWSNAKAIGDNTCGYKTGFTNNSNTTWVVSKTETVKVKISGAEDDSGFCSSDLSGSNDGECSPSPYAYNTTLPWAYRAYNANTSTWFTQNTGNGVDIDSRCPYGWSGDNYGTIENCMKENGTNDYSFRWRYRWHFGNTAGTLSGMNSPNINGSDYTTCSGSYDRGTLTASSYTNCAYATQWQYSFNDGAWTNISGATGDTYNPPNRTEGKHEYRVRKAYRTSFSGATGYTYSNVRTDIIGHTPSIVSITTSDNCWVTNNSNTYTITARVRDNGSGIDRVLVLINYGDTGGNPDKGYFSADNDGYVWTGASAQGAYVSDGYYATKYASGYGHQYITLVGFNSYTSGSDRYFVWTVRPDSDMPEGIDNDISYALYDEVNSSSPTCNDTWTSGTPGANNYNVNFTTYQPPLATASVNNSAYCTGAGSATFTLSNPSPGSFVRWQYRWNNTGSWINWGTTNPYTWSNSTNCGNTLYVRAQMSYGNCTEYSNVVTTTVDCNPSGTTTASEQYICSGGTTNFETTPSGGTFVRHEYQWDGTGGSWSDWGTSNPHVWTPGNPSFNGRYLYVRGVVQNGTCITYTTPTWTRLYFDPTAPSVTRNPNVSTVCVGASLDLTINNGGTNGIADDGSACVNQYLSLIHI